MSSDKHNLVVKRSSAGLGLFAGDAIKKGMFVVEYTGKKLKGKKADESTGKYLFELDKHTIIDGKGRENIARYINHSCKPNCEVVIEGGQILIKSIKNIKIGDEITYHYGEEYFNEYIKPVGCKCAYCRKKKT